MSELSPSCKGGDWPAGGGAGRRRDFLGIGAESFLGRVPVNPASLMVKVPFPCDN